MYKCDQCNSTGIKGIWKGKYLLNKCALIYSEDLITIDEKKDIITKIAKEHNATDIENVSGEFLCPQCQSKHYYPKLELSGLNQRIDAYINNVISEMKQKSIQEQEMAFNELEYKFKTPITKSVKDFIKKRIHNMEDVECTQEFNYFSVKLKKIIKKSIVLSACDFEDDIWKKYCELLDVNKYSLEVKLTIEDIDILI